MLPSGLGGAIDGVTLVACLDGRGAATGGLAVLGAGVGGWTLGDDGCEDRGVDVGGLILGDNGCEDLGVEVGTTLCSLRSLTVVLACLVMGSGILSCSGMWCRACLTGRTNDRFLLNFFPSAWIS